MRVRYSEDPKEWRTFALSSSAALMLVLGLLAWRKVLAGGEVWALAALPAALLIAALACPHRLRWFYRGGMWVGGTIGHVVGLVILSVMFWLLVVPLGWFLRILGKDLLGLARPKEVTTYWRPSPPLGPLDRQF